MSGYDKNDDEAATAPEGRGINGCERFFSLPSNEATSQRPPSMLDAALPLFLLLASLTLSLSVGVFIRNDVYFLPLLQALELVDVAGRFRQFPDTFGDCANKDRKSGGGGDGFGGAGEGPADGGAGDPAVPQAITAAAASSSNAKANAASTSPASSSSGQGFKAKLKKGLGSGW
jgi:hypothetical protein